MTVEQIVVVGIATLVLIVAWHLEVLARGLVGIWDTLRDLVRNH